MHILEYTASRTEFSQILNHKDLRMGFECEIITDIEKYRDGDYDDGEADPDLDEMDWEEMQDFLILSPRKRKALDDRCDEWRADARRADWRRNGDLFVADWCANHGDVNPAEPKNRNLAFYEWLAQTHDHFMQAYDMDAFIRAHYRSNHDFIEAEGIDRQEQEYETGQEDVDPEEACQWVLQRLQRTEFATWGVVTDTSVSDEDCLGVEVISDVYTIQDGLDKMESFFDWMQINNYRTNRSTGLHVSFSIVGKNSASDYDFLKMTMLFDENYTANLFDRLNARWCEQMRTTLFGSMQEYSPNLMSGMQLDQACEKLKKLGKSMPSYGISKYYSFRCRNDGVIEFRGMGGAHYDHKFDLIRKRVINMAMMLLVGSDTKLMQREYLKRVYQMLTSKRFSQASVQKKIYAAPKPPPGLESFKTGFNLDMKRDYDMGNYAGCAAKLVRWALVQNNPMTPIQLRQLRFFLASKKVSPAVFLRDVRSPEWYQYVAAMMKWPSVVTAAPPNADDD